jgi:hypothetical protein
MPRSANRARTLALILSVLAIILSLTSVTLSIRARSTLTMPPLERMLAQGEAALPCLGAKAFPGASESVCFRGDGPLIETLVFIDDFLSAARATPTRGWEVIEGQHVRQWTDAYGVIVVAIVMTTPHSETDGVIFRAGSKGYV